MKKDYRLPVMRFEVLYPGINMTGLTNPSNYVQGDDAESQYHGFGSAH